MRGKKVASGTPLDLKNKYTGDFITLYNICEDDIKQSIFHIKRLMTIIEY